MLALITDRGDSRPGDVPLGTLCRRRRLPCRMSATRIPRLGQVRSRAFRRAPRPNAGRLRRSVPLADAPGSRLVPDESGRSVRWRLRRQVGAGQTWYDTGTARLLGGKAWQYSRLPARRRRFAAQPPSSQQCRVPLLRTILNNGEQRRVTTWQIGLPSSGRAQAIFPASTTASAQPS